MTWSKIAPRVSTVPAKPVGLWTLVSEFVDPSRILRITAPVEKCWSYADALEAKCGPDGDRTALLYPSKCLVPSAPVGALVGKIGGSASGVKDGQTFVVGSYCVVSVAPPGGPLYLTINDEAAGMANNAGAVRIVIEVQVEDVPFPVPPAPAVACTATILACCPNLIVRTHNVSR